MTISNQQLVSLLRRALGSRWLRKFINGKVIDMNKQRIAQLEAEHRKLKEQLRQARNELAAAEADQRSQRNDISATRLATALATVRAAELAVEGVVRDIERAHSPSVRITSSQRDLEQRRAQLVRQGEITDREYEGQCEQIRAMHPHDPPEWNETRINNAMGPTAYYREKAKRERQAEIDHIDAQLAEFDRRETAEVA
ncbi:hypothetical protein Rctr16k_20 [Virus Rctr16k]|nr:hypothetical protein Rctr16k_20 [Virus Rctr16k]